MAPLAILLGMFFGSVGYGVNLISFCTCIVTLLLVDGHLKSKSEINYPMVVAAILMILVATSDIVVEVIQNVTIFIEKNLLADPRVGGESRWWSTALFIFFVIQMTIGDTILIYRCYIVWGRKLKVILLSVLLSMTATGCGLASIITVTAHFLSNNRGRETPLITTMLVVTLTSNALSSSLIVFRIWTVHKETAHYNMYRTRKNDPLRQAIRVTVEAGLLYTISLIVLLSIYLTGGEAQNVVFRSIVQIIGITFNLVISRTSRKHIPSHIHSSAMTTPHINTSVLGSREPAEASDTSPDSNSRSSAGKAGSIGSWPTVKPTARGCNVQDPEGQHDRFISQ